MPVLCFSYLPTTLATFAPLLAEKSMSFSWAIVMFFVIAGLVVALLPSKRKSEVKKPKD